ncbi:MAG: hypothetical protein HY874_10150 [Chloroflexi bacterium]|nr:hypothetical protein [Chloroflexota bacterium]
MNPRHDLYCDRNHTPRQRCNGALANARISEGLSPRAPAQPQPVPPPASGDAGAPSANGAAHAEEPQPDDTRDAVATAEVPEPTAYVTREWSKTAAAVEKAHRPALPPAPIERRGAPGPTITIAGGVISFVLLVVIVVRRRRRKSPQ